MTAVIDTCVVIDVLQNREPFFKDAFEIFLAVSNRKFMGVLTAKSVMDIYYIIHRSLHDEQQTRAAVNKLFALFDVADTFSADCRIAVSSQTTDYEDAVMIETAKRIGADCIVTRNLWDYSKSSVPVFYPEEFLHKLKGEQEE